ncbi:MAG: septal ring lytic transglycosylase RlpA family protein [Cyclobacteriaceae bacterium]|nr:septal ring lytic transglycosylase RlpA family protein [Cyclobacteriaceae bacterium]
MHTKLFFIGVLYFIIFSAYSQTQTGKASYYADKFEGRTTANGEKYKHTKLTAAHRLLPFGTVVKVTNIKNGKSVEVRVNDRGPFVNGRIIDLSKMAAERLDFIHDGITEVKVEVVDHGDGKGGGQTKPSYYSEVEEKEFYAMDIDRASPKGFGVQIGLFQEMANLVRLTQNLKSSYKKKVTLQVKVVNEKKVYAIILGEFPNREKASSFKKNVAKRYPDAFIVEYAKL